MKLYVYLAATFAMGVPLTALLVKRGEYASLVPFLIVWVVAVVRICQMHGPKPG